MQTEQGPLPSNQALQMQERIDIDRRLRTVEAIYASAYARVRSLEEKLGQEKPGQEKPGQEKADKEKQGY